MPLTDRHIFLEYMMNLVSQKIITKRESYKLFDDPWFIIFSFEGYKDLVLEENSK